jgi:hypothetical protein
MDVTRATAATRVDENGLVNYAEVIGGEEVTNGDFATASDWTLGSGWAYGTNKIEATSTGATCSQVIFGSAVSRSVKITVDVIVSGGSVAIYMADLSKVFISISGSYSYFVTSSSDTLEIDGNNGTPFTGSVTNVSVKEAARDNVPRIDFTGGGCPHILAEPMRTNLVTYSEDFTDSSWTKLGAGTGTTAVVTSDYAISPDGTQNATRLVCDLNGGGGSVSNQSLIYDLYSSSGDQSLSIYVKSNSGSNQTIYFANTQTSGDTIIATNEWQRFTFSHSTTNYVFAVGLRGRTGGAIDDTADILIWGGQAEVGSYPTSYIPNFGTALGVTRNQDIFTRDGIGSLINSTEGVLFVEMAALADDGTNRMIVIKNPTGYTAGSAYIYYTANSNELSYRYFDNSGNLQASITVTVTDTLVYNKIAFTWANGNYKLYINGLSVGTNVGLNGNTCTANTLTEINFNRDGSLDFYGKVKQLQVYDTALTDTQLAALTS